MRADRWEVAVAVQLPEPALLESELGPKRQKLDLLMGWSEQIMSWKMGVSHTYCKALLDWPIVWPNECPEMWQTSESLEMH